MANPSTLRDDARQLRRKMEQVQVALQKAHISRQRADAIWRGTRCPPAVILERVRFEELEAGRDFDRDAWRYRTFCSDLFVRLRLHVTYSVTPASRQGHAWSMMKRIEVEPIRDLDTLMGALHEAGHCVTACTPPKHRPTRAGAQKICVRCEIESWKRAVEWIVLSNEFSFRRGMHDALSDSLGTYTPYATSDERAEIRRMQGVTWWREALCRCLTR